MGKLSLGGDTGDWREEVSFVHEKNKIETKGKIKNIFFTKTD
jgi:hypothetical protein